MTAHLVDLAQWMIASEQGADYARNVFLTAARQWPTDIPLNIFSRITGLGAFPDVVRHVVTDGVRRYPCNAKINYTLRGVPVEVDAIWNLAIPEGGGDTHYGILRDTCADLIVDQGPDTGFGTRLRVSPARHGHDYEPSLARAVQAARNICPGVGYRGCTIRRLANDTGGRGAGTRETGGHGGEITIPAAMHQGHEARFPGVLYQFLGYVGAGKWPKRVSEELVANYTLLANAYELSHR